MKHDRDFDLCDIIVEDKLGVGLAVKMNTKRNLDTPILGFL